MGIFILQKMSVMNKRVQKMILEDDRLCYPEGFNYAVVSPEGVAIEIFCRKCYAEAFACYLPNFAVVQLEIVFK